MCISYSMKVNYLGCTVIYHPCILGGVQNFISIYYTNEQSQNTCLSAATGCFSIAVFGVRKNGLMDQLPAKTYLPTAGVIG